ncbi:MAG: hypothetical protein HYR84_02640 [Planctomycetes bacterium]|nr:hypothetical protein [Planctomycetota bacterium]
MIVIAAVVIVMMAVLVIVMVVRVGLGVRRGGGWVIVGMVAGFARLMIVAAARTVRVLWRGCHSGCRRGLLSRRGLVRMRVGMIVIVMMAWRMIVVGPWLKRGIARLLPKDGATNERKKHQADAAQQDIEVKLFGQQHAQHSASLGVRVAEGLENPKAEADDAERAGKADHAELIDEVGVVVVRMIVVMIVGVSVLVSVGMAGIVVVLMGVFSHRHTSFQRRGWESVSIQYEANGSVGSLYRRIAGRL